MTMRYIIGIDLGTTNSSVAYVDTQKELLHIQQFRIPQLTASDVIEHLATLPSFCYLSGKDEWPQGALKLPWSSSNGFFIGKFAQTQGAKVPTRLVQSAKSWLCHAAVNRKDKLLPFELGDSSSRISPVEASTRYLKHIKEAWNYSIAKGDHTQEFEQQEIVLTVPASFDEAARRLTVEAAAQAGFLHMTLLEEPQAAFYSWLAQNEAVWQKKLHLGASILVCDVGGGTSDFSLIEVAGTEEKPVLKRQAVGNHLLLGGDNIDAALAHFLEKRAFQHREASSLQWLQLQAEARSAKEAMLSDKENNENYPIVLQSAGSSIIKESIMTHLSKEEVFSVALEGFFGLHAWDDALKLKKTAGMRVMGLPYEDEPSITKHLAKFLFQSAGNQRPIKGPDFVLFNGGTMKPGLFQKAIVDNLVHWFFEKAPEVLSSYHLDLAVARGAVYFGKVRRGFGTKISGGSARAYYLRVDMRGSGDHKALTLLSRGADEGASYEPDYLFQLRPNTPISFELYTSHVRLDDQAGDLIPIDEEQLQPLPQLRTFLRFGKGSEASEQLLPVHLHVRLNTIGILELTLRSQKTEHIWDLEFQLKNAEGQDNTLSSISVRREDELIDQSYLDEGKKLIREVYSNQENKTKPDQLIESLEKLYDKPKQEWLPSLLRNLFESLAKVGAERKKSPVHELRWWNLAGFFLRPGKGYPLDDFRIKELWKIILADAKTGMSKEVQLQKWICFRRIAAGLNKGQQLQLASELFGSLQDKRTGKLADPLKGEGYLFGEKLRTLASLEWIEPTMKKKLGDFLVARIVAGKATSAEYWALGRIGARILLYGALQNVVSKEICTLWLESLLHQSTSNERELIFVFGQLARKTDCREINVSQSLVDKLLARFPELNLESHAMTLVEEEQLFGEQLPPGLILHA